MGPRVQRRSARPRHRRHPRRNEPGAIHGSGRPRDGQRSAATAPAGAQRRARPIKPVPDLGERDREKTGRSDPESRAATESALVRTPDGTAEADRRTTRSVDGKRDPRGRLRNERRLRGIQRGKPTPDPDDAAGPPGGNRSGSASADRREEGTEPGATRRGRGRANDSASCCRGQSVHTTEAKPTAHGGWGSRRAGSRRRCKAWRLPANTGIDPPAKSAPEVAPAMRSSA